MKNVRKNLNDTKMLSDGWRSTDGFETGKFLEFNLLVLNLLFLSLFLFIFFPNPLIDFD